VAVGRYDRLLIGLCGYASVLSQHLAVTTIEGSSLPSMPARTLRAVEIAMRIAAPLPSPALGGLRITLRPGGPWRG
jgi:hypothetical protein